MISGFSTVSLVVGTSIAYIANGYPKHRAILETVGGVLLLAGLGLMGYAVELVLGHP